MGTHMIEITQSLTFILYANKKLAVIHIMLLNEGHGGTVGSAVASLLEGPEFESHSEPPSSFQ